MLNNYTYFVQSIMLYCYTYYTILKHILSGVLNFCSAFPLLWAKKSY